MKTVTTTKTMGIEMLAYRLLIPRLPKDQVTMIETDLPERLYLRCEQDGFACGGPDEIKRLRERPHYVNEKIKVEIEQLRKFMRVESSLAKQLSQSMAINARLNEENKRLKEEINKLCIQLRIKMP